MPQPRVSQLGAALASGLPARWARPALVCSCCQEACPVVSAPTHAAPPAPAPAPFVAPLIAPLVAPLVAARSAPFF